MLIPSDCYLILPRLSCFFSYYPGAHQDLHSFPTRRSSDLGTCGQRVSGTTVRAYPDPKYFDSPHVSRSEEHTSELQSRPHLVCRLLLEKKKTTTPRLPTPPRHEPGPCSPGRCPNSSASGCR